VVLHRCWPVAAGTGAGEVEGECKSMHASLQGKDQPSYERDLRDWPSPQPKEQQPRCRTR
jgi:hypothetical protein